jgi:peptide/nickel transport system ATP-binding protein
MMDSDIILSVRNLSIEYATDDGIVKAVNNLSLDLKKGETLGLVGETGAGKTTTALGIMRLVPDPPGIIKSGEILFGERDLVRTNNLRMRLIRGKEISMIFQDPMTALNPVLTVGDQIAEVIKLHSKVSTKDSFIKAAEMLEVVGIPAERMNEYPHQFSGGMKQRVVIAIALACNPSIIIADEPTTALDVTIQAQVLELMRQLKEKFDTAMLLITHDLGVVAEVCEKVAIMYAGEIVESGSLVNIFDETRHPYTKGLFASLPSMNIRSKRLNPIHGLMPDPVNLPSGCPFHPRCSEAMPICSERKPLMTTLSPGHSVKCLLYEGPVS